MLTSLPAFRASYPRVGSLLAAVGVLVLAAACGGSGAGRSNSMSLLRQRVGFQLIVPGSLRGQWALLNYAVAGKGKDAVVTFAYSPKRQLINVTEQTRQMAAPAGVLRGPYQVVSFAGVRWRKYTPYDYVRLASHGVVVQIVLPSSNPALAKHILDAYSTD